MASDFLATYTPLANDIATHTGLDPSVVLGIIDTETGGGQHVSGNNIFGISPGGKVAQYPDVQTGSQAFVSLMQTPRYQGVAAAGSPAAQAMALVKSGYNTANPAYATTVAGKAQSFSKELGYQGGGDAKPAAAPDYNTPAPAAAPAKQATGTAKDRVLSDPALNEGRSTAPDGSAKDRVLSDPALQEAAKPPEPEQDPLSGGYLGGKLPPPDAGQPITALPIFPRPAPGAVGRIIDAAREGYQASTPDVTPGNLLSPINYGLAQIPGVLGGALRGGQQLVNEAISPINPQLGRDVAALPEAFPTGDYGQSAGPATAQQARNYLRQPITVADLTGAIQRSDAAAIGPSIRISPETRPMVGEPAPASVGAAATSGTFGLSPKEAAAYRSTAEGQKLLEAQQPGIPDRNAYVPGVEPSAADIEQSVNTSRELKSLKLQAPAVSEEARTVAAQNNDARRIHFEQLAGSDVSLMNAKAARAAQADADLKATWAGKTDADPAGVLAKADEIKASPDGRRPLVRNAIDSVTSELTGSDGKLITDPEQLYGVRKHIDDLTSREATVADPKNIRAMAALDQLKTELDTVIEASAPGFKQYLQNFSDASRPIDAMEALQKFEPKLYDAQNRMQYSRVQSMMRQIVDARSAPGINPFKSIPDATMQQLWNLRDDLRRSAGAEELARTTGSDTAQNAWDIAKTYAKLGGTAAAHGVANYISPGFGSMALSGARNMLAPIFSARTARQQTGRGMEMLHPPGNLLEPPP